VTRSRTAAAAIALVARVGVVIAGARVTVPFTLFQPGPTINVLGKLDGRQILEVKGHPVYRGTGQLRMVPIVLPQPLGPVSVWSALYAWLNPSDALYPTSVMYGKGETNAQNKAEDAQLMSSSQEDAVAAALGLAGIRYTSRPAVASVMPGAPAAGKLKPGDAFVAINGVATPTAQQLVRQVRSRPPGSTLRVEVRRGNATRVYTMRTVPAGTTPALRKQARIGVGLNMSYHFPFTVKVRLSDSIGGPSAGMMFALAIYDLLTPGSVTDGRSVAGTGTITAAGTVGVIGGIAQKIAGAQADGARLFLVPAGNCDEAVHAHYDPAKMRLVKVSTLKGALGAIRAWAANSSANLPECPR
jgi:PDZ domain-containing protein